MNNFVFLLSCVWITFLFVNKLTPHFVFFAPSIPVCPFCKYSLRRSREYITHFAFNSHFASVFLFPTLLTLQSFRTVKVHLPHSHLACPSLHCPCGRRAVPSPPRMPTSRAVQDVLSSTVTLWTWAALMGPLAAPPEEATTLRLAPVAPGNTVTPLRAWTGSGPLES